MFDRATGSRGDGLWQAAADGKVSEDAFELHSKAAAWSSTTGAFELDLLEVTRHTVVFESVKLALSKKPLASTAVYFYPLWEPRDGNVQPLRLCSLNFRPTHKK